MKICRITSAYSPYSFGGADIYSEKISKEVVKKGNPTVIITINPKAKDEYAQDCGTSIYRFHPFNISTVHDIGKKPLLQQGIWTILDLFSYYSYLKIKGILEKEKPDVVHIHTPLDVTLSCVIAAKKLGLPVVYTLHDYFLLCRRIVLLHRSGNICEPDNMNKLCGLYRRFTRKLISGKVDIVIAPSNFVLKLHKKNGFFNDCAFRILSHGIDLDSSEHDKPAGNKKTFDVLYVGGLTKHKGVHVLIKAFTLIREEKLRLHIVGSGVYENYLKKLAANDRRIIFHGKHLNSGIKQFYQNADVLVVPSIWYDVRPNVIIEAFREKTAVIGSDIGGIPELISNGKTGFLFNPVDVSKLQEVILYCIKNPEELKRMGKNGYESIKELEMSKYVDKLVNIYNEAVEINNEKRL